LVYGKIFQGVHSVYVLLLPIRRGPPCELGMCMQQFRGLALADATQWAIMSMCGLCSMVQMPSLQKYCVWVIRDVFGLLRSKVIKKSKKKKDWCAMYQANSDDAPLSTFSASSLSRRHVDAVVRPRRHQQNARAGGVQGTEARWRRRRLAGTRGTSRRRGRR